MEVGVVGFPDLLQIVLGTRSKKGACSSASFGIENRIRPGYTEAVRKMDCPRPPVLSTLWALWSPDKFNVYSGHNRSPEGICLVSPKDIWQVEF